MPTGSGSSSHRSPAGPNRHQKGLVPGASRFQRSMMKRTRMRVATVRKDGSEYNVHWVGIPPPTLVAYRGLARIEQYVDRVLKSQSTFASLIISRPDGNISISVWKLKGALSVGASFGVPAAARVEAEFRTLAAARGLRVVDDYLSNQGRIRMVSVALIAACDRISQFARHLLHNVFGIRRLGALQFSFEERAVD